jgi:hypothetical protein
MNKDGGLGCAEEEAGGEPSVLVGGASRSNPGSGGEETDGERPSGSRVRASAIPPLCGDLPGEVPSREAAGGDPIGPKPRSLEWFGRCTGRDCGIGDRSLSGPGDTDDTGLPVAGVNGESLPFAAMAAVIPEDEEPWVAVFVDREDGRRADNAEWLGLIPAAAAAAKLVAIPEPRRGLESPEDWWKSASCIEGSEAIVDTVGAAFPIVIGGRDEIESEEGLPGAAAMPEGVGPAPAFDEVMSRFPSPRS